MKQIILTLFITLMIAETAHACLLQNGLSSDLNSDGIIGIGDVVVLVNNWGAKSTDNGWNNQKFADLNGDGSLGIGDVVVLVNKWGEICSLNPNILRQYLKIN